MITLKSSTSDGSSYQVYDDDELIGHIIRQRGTSGDRYRATIEMNGKTAHPDREFDSSHQALKWIEKCRTGSL